MRNNSPLSARLFIAALILASLAATYFAWLYASLDAKSLAHERFQARVLRIQSAIQERMLAYEQVLRGGVGLFVASHNVSRQEWHDYVQSLLLSKNYPGIQGIGFAKWIPPAELNKHIAQVRGEGFPEYMVKPAGIRAEYTSIIYLEPFDARNQRAFGFDMFSEATRRAAMEMARDAGKTIISGKVKLLQETQNDIQNGFLMYLPVYDSSHPENAKQRRAALKGYVYSAFRMNDLMQGVLGKSAPDVALEIYDGLGISANEDMYKSSNLVTEHEPLFSDTRDIAFNDHPWTLHITSLPVFESDIDRRAPEIIAISGIALTGLMSLLLWSLLSTRARAVALANAMTVSALENEERFSSVVNTAADGIIVISDAGIIESTNAAASRIFGHIAGEMVGNNINMLMPEPYHSQHDGYLDRYIRTGVARVIGIGREVIGLRKDGTTFPMELSVGEMHMGKQRKFTGFVRDISERKLADKKLAETMRLQHAILESASYAIISTTVDGTILLFNQAAEKMLGYSAEELVGKATPAILHLPEEVVARAKILSAQLNKNIEPGFEVFAAKSRLGEIDENEWTYICKNGSHVPVMLSVTAQRDKDNQITGFLGIADDISERKIFEATIRDSEERYRMMAENSSDMIFRLSAAGTLNYVSPASVMLLGYVSVSMLGKSFYEWVHPEDKAMVTQRLAGIFDNAAPDTVTCRMRKANGSFIWMESSLRGLKEITSHTKQQIIGVSRDVTERVQTTASLNRFKQILDNTLDMLFMFEPDNLRFVYVNKGAADSMGFTNEELLELTPYHIKPLISERQFKELIAPLLSGEKQSLNFETVHQRKDGSTFPVEIFLQFVSEVDGKGIFVAIVRDITERKKVDRLKNEFVSTVSHELRTPLTSIRGSLGLIAGGVAGEVSAQAKSLINIAYKNSERLVRLINDILDVEKIESGKMVLNLKHLDLMTILEQSVEANRAYGAGFGVSYKITSVMDGVQVNVDEDRILQVMANLLSNAAKFSPANGQVDIVVNSGKLGPRIIVRDKGMGIPKEFQSQVFQKFSQADSSDTRQKGGTGLGLSITKAIVEKMGGVIGFDAEEGAGTEFYFELPESIKTEKGLASIRSDHQLSPRKLPRILICEDDEDIAVLLGLMLKEGGFDTDVALNAKQAKELLKLNNYDAMTLDLGLPDQNGISLIRELRGQEETANLSIVVVSAQAEQGRAEINGGYALVGWLDKPIDRDMLLSKLNEAVLKHHEYHIPRILHVEDDPDVRHILSTIGKGIAEFDHASTLQEASEKLATLHYDLVVLDLGLPDGSGLNIVPLLQGLNYQTPVMIFSGENVSQLDANKVASVLIKSSTSNQELLNTITQLLARGTSEI